MWSFSLRVNNFFVVLRRREIPEGVRKTRIISYDKLLVINKEKKNIELNINCYLQGICIFRSKRVLSGH